MTTTVVNQYKESCDMSIMRPGPWGNQYIIGRDGTREEVVAKFKHDLDHGQTQRDIWRRANLYYLKDKRLGCCCKPKVCHGDGLATAADTLP